MSREKNARGGPCANAPFRLRHAEIGELFDQNERRIYQEATLTLCGCCRGASKRHQKGPAKAASGEERGPAIIELIIKHAVYLRHHTGAIKEGNAGRVVQGMH
eukprot:IDg15504t1